MIDTELIAANAIGAARYKIVRDLIDWILEDEDGLAGCAFSCQIPLELIDKATSAELLDAIIDAHGLGYPESPDDQPAPLAAPSGPVPERREIE